MFQALWQRPLASIPCALAVPQSSRSMEGGGLAASVSPGAVKRKNKPHRISVLATKRSPAASLGHLRSVKQPRGCCLSSPCLTQGHPFPVVLEVAVGALLQQSIVPKPELCSCSNLTHPHRFQKTKEIPKQTNTKPRKQPEGGEMEVWGKKEMGERLKPNVSTPN